MKQLFTCLLLGISLWSSRLEAQNSKLSIEREPTWITVNEIALYDKAFEGEAEDGYLDVEVDRQTSLEMQARYYKKTIRILSEAGVQNSSEVSVNFNPAYEKLIFHTVSIIRDGKQLNKLQLSKFKIIQQEKELDKHLYDGSLTALLVLDDVRKGDIIITSYTIRGFNPIFAGKYSSFYPCTFGVPIPNLYYKLIVPASRTVNIQYTSASNHITPLISKSGSNTIYEWKATNVKAVHTESKTPSWFDPTEYIMVSEYNNWAEVSNWAATLFPRNLQLSAGLQQKINNIKAANSTDETRTLAALQFVQDDVRYMGIEMGVNSHKPGHPNKIFSQKFGDCKDKSYLLVSMLNAMGIAADPVLINTTDKRMLMNFLPSASIFDHCTAQAKVNGRIYRFDPTISYQRGKLGDISYPDYQAGLVVNTSTTSLATIPFQDKGMADIREIFNVKEMNGSTNLKVITTNTGSYADEARYYYNNNSLYEIRNKYKDFYAYYFEKLTADSLTYSDNEKTGAFTTTEYYTIKNIWKTTGATKKIPLSSYVINSIMTKPSDKNRTMPFALHYPARYKEQIEVNMPEDWPITPYDDHITSDGFTLAAKAEAVANKVTLTYEYEALKDHIMPAEADAFFDKYDQAYDATAYELTYRPGTQASYKSSGESSLPSVGIFPKLYMMLGLVTVITFIVRSRKPRQY